MKQPDLLHDDVKGLFSRYLFPSISATLVTSIYILADTVLIGRGVGAIGIAALNILLPLFSVFFGTGMLYGVGGSVLLSICKGRSDERGAREYFTIACVLAAITSVLYLMLCLLFFDQVTGLLGRNETMDFYVRDYGVVLVAGAPVFLFSALFQSFVRNDKAPKKAMAAVISGGVTNVVLDYIFIFPCGMGMKGGAVATVIGSIVTLLILLTHFLNPNNTLKISPGIPWRKAKAVFVNGFASFLLEVSNGVVMFLFNRQLLSYVGDLGVVVYGIISNSALIVNSVCNGISQASQPILAVNFGAGKTSRVNKALKLGLGMAGIIGLLFCMIGLLVPEMVANIFVKTTEEILNLAVPAVRMYFVAFLFTGFNILLSTYFQSIMKPVYSLVICLSRGVVISGILVMVLPAVFGVNGIWLTMGLAEMVTLAVGAFFMHREMRMQHGKTV